MENQQKALQASLRAENAGNTTVAAQLAEMASPEARPRMNLREKAQRAQRAPGGSRETQLRQFCKDQQESPAWPSSSSPGNLAASLCK